MMISLELVLLSFFPPNPHSPFNENHGTREMAFFKAAIMFVSIVWSLVLA